jgi:GTP-binding protein HflX
MEQELEEVRRQREVQRKQRERQGIPVCALVGYTNAGKSSLMNALTGAGLPAENKLFVTLDAVSRRFEPQKGFPVLLVDTVGFIRKLPHALVDAFRSTLEEAVRADLLIHVLDASDPDIDRYYETTVTVLEELGAGRIPRIDVLNKIDRLGDLADLRRRYPDAVALSARSPAELSGTTLSAGQEGLKELCARLEQSLAVEILRFCFPLDRPDLASLLHRGGQVMSETWEEEGIVVEARVDGKLLGQLKSFLKPPTA